MAVFVFVRPRWLESFILASPKSATFTVPS